LNDPPVGWVSLSQRKWIINRKKAIAETKNVDKIGLFQIDEGSLSMKSPGSDKSMSGMRDSPTLPCGERERRRGKAERKGSYAQGNR
jgi:hypothetical protein